MRDRWRIVGWLVSLCFGKREWFWLWCGMVWCRVGVVWCWLLFGSWLVVTAFELYTRIDRVGCVCIYGFSIITSAMYLALSCVATATAIAIAMALALAWHSSAGRIREGERVHGSQSVSHASSTISSSLTGISYTCFSIRTE